MSKKISEAIKNANDMIGMVAPETNNDLIAAAQTFALIAIAEALLQQNQRLEYQDEIAEMRSERLARQRSGD